MRIPVALLFSAIITTPAFAEDTPAPAVSAEALPDAPADTADASADPADTIVVTANRTAQPISRVGQSISVVDSAEIQRRQSNTISDILRTLPGVSITRNGGVGQTTSVFIRGAESEQTVALIDGVKLNDPSAPSGGVDFSNLLVGNIDRIEVLRGSQSVLWGSQAIGGVVNIITRPPTEQLAVNARAEGGYRNTAQFVGNASVKLGPLSTSIGGGYFRSDGISAFSEARGGVERDGYENLAANANFRLAITDAISVDARGWYSDGLAGIDGFAPPLYNFGDTAETSRSRQLVAYTGINAAFFGGRFRNRLGFAYTNTHRHNDDQGFETFAADGRNERIEYQGIVDIAEGWQATAGLERETSRFTSSSFGSTTRGRARLDSVYGQLVATPLKGLTVTGGVRQDDHDRFGGATSFSASGVYTIGATGTTLRASYTEGFKAPTLYQLQSEYGNTLLRPERAKGWDVGITQHALGDKVEASVTYFRRTTTDLINFISCTPPLTGICTNRPDGTYDNVARARADGVEVGLAVRPVTGLQVQANYTYLNALNQSPASANFGKRLTRRPQHSVSALIDYRWSFGLTTGATVTHVGDSFENAANTLPLNSYVLVDLRASYPVTPHIELYGRIENLLDERYEIARSYGQPGRAGYAGVRVRF